MNSSRSGGDLDLAASDPEALYRQRFSFLTSGRIVDPELARELPCHLGVRFAVALTGLSPAEWSRISRMPPPLARDAGKRLMAAWEHRLGKRIADELILAWDVGHAAAAAVALGWILHRMEEAADSGRVGDFENWDRLREWFMERGQGSSLLGPSAGYFATHPYCVSSGVDVISGDPLIPFSRIVTTRLRSDPAQSAGSMSR
jgi:hypothetical protein